MLKNVKSPQYQTIYPKHDVELNKTQYWVSNSRWNRHDNWKYQYT